MALDKSGLVRNAMAQIIIIRRLLPCRDGPQPMQQWPGMPEHHAVHGLSLLGSLVQIGIEMTYDIDNTRLIFDTTTAHMAAAPPVHSLTMMMLLYHLAVWVVLF
jgi:hypothetical protein